MNLKKIIFGNYSNKQILAKNTFWLGGLEVVSKVIMFIVTVSLVRYLGPEGFGAYNFASAYVAIIMIFSDLGLSTILTRDVAKNKAEVNRYLSNVMGIKLATSVLIIAVVLILTPLLGSYRTYFWLILLTTIYNLSLQFQTVIVAVLSAFEKMEYVFVVRTVYYMGILLAAMATIKLNLGVNMLVANYLSVGILNLVTAIWLLNKIGVRIKIEINRMVWQKMLKESAPMLGFIAGSQIYGNIDTLLVAKFFGNTEVGWYQSAYKILFAFQSVNIINSVTFPRFAVLIQEKKETTLNKLLKIIISGSLVILVPLAIIISWQSELIIKLIYGSKYLAAAPMVAILIWVGVINYFRILVTNLLVARGKQKMVFYAMTAGLLVNICLNLVVMPRTGFLFAAVSLIISEVVILGTAIKLMNKSDLNKVTVA